MIQHLYRYRPIDAVLDGHHELEKQEIYVSTPAELNDPLEGFKDIFWSGDRTVWQNLLRHYILCLLETAMSAFMLGSEFDEAIVESIVFGAPDSLPDAPVREIYARVARAFFEEGAVQKFLAFVADRPAPLRAAELKSYLRALHALALEEIFKEFEARDLIPKGGPGADVLLDQVRKSAQELFKDWPSILGSNQTPENVFATIAGISEHTVGQVNLIFEYSQKDEAKRGLIFFTRHFASAYVDALEKLVHNNWYVACFTDSATNPYMWSNYAQGHRGVCLKFATPSSDDGQPRFTAQRVTSVSGSKGRETRYGESFVRHELYKTTYDGRFPAIDFFRSLGTVRHSFVDGFWYLADDGSFSVCRKAISDDETAWRDAYWKTFIASAICKTSEWAQESEYRMVVHSNIFDMRAKERRKLKYRFTDLVGITFGARTTQEDKLKIMRIVDAKCAEVGRKEFEFAEVVYSREQGKFVERPLSLLKLSATVETPI